MDQSLWLRTSAPRYQRKPACYPTPGAGRAATEWLPVLLLLPKPLFPAAHPTVKQTPETFTSTRTSGYAGLWSPNASWQWEGSLLGDIMDGALEPIRIGGDLIRAGTQLVSLGTHELGWTGIYEYEPRSRLMQGWFQACVEGRGGEYLRDVELGVLTLGIKPLGEAICDRDWRNVSRMVGGYLTAGGTTALLRPRPGSVPLRVAYLKLSLTKQAESFDLPLGTWETM